MRWSRLPNKMVSLHQGWNCPQIFLTIPFNHSICIMYIKTLTVLIIIICHTPAATGLLFQSCSWISWQEHRLKKLSGDAFICHFRINILVFHHLISILICTPTNQQCTSESSCRNKVKEESPFTPSWTLEIKVGYKCKERERERRREKNCRMPFQCEC